MTAGDEKRRAAASRLLDFEIGRLRRAMTTVTGKTDAAGAPLCQKRFLTMAERHAEMIATYDR